jgi:OOP family OmpA-OmpF porin
MLVAGPQRGLFLACLGLGAYSLVTLNLQFAPLVLSGGSAGAIEPARVVTPPQAPSVRPRTNEEIVDVPPAEPQATLKQALPAAARVPTIVAKFDSQAKEPSDLSGVRALATAMIEDHETSIVLEGHSDTLGGEDFNQTISLQRAEWVKSRLVELGVSPERIETVGLGATHPLRSDLPDAQAVNRRVEVRWVGR